MIASSNVQFFNKDWQHIGNKKTLAGTLTYITGVPERILKDGLAGNRPCVAQIISWAANRTTTRVEDKAYSLMGLLDVNMPMLYGEGKKAFHRLQLEIVRTLNDQSIFAWDCNGENVRPGSILADDPNFFKNCSTMKLMDHDEFIKYLQKYIPEDQLPSITQDRFGTFPVTNRGIQIWMLLHRYENSNSVFQAWLPCRSQSLGPPVTINLALWNSDYYRYPSLRMHFSTEHALQFCQVFLRYQDMFPDVTFEIDDSAMSEQGFTCCATYPLEVTGNRYTSPGDSPIHTRSYSTSQGNRDFVVAFGQCFGHSYIFGGSIDDGRRWLVEGPERAQSMATLPSRSDHYCGIWVYHIHLPGSTWIMRVSRIVWERSRIGVRIEAWRDPSFLKGLDEWKVLDVEVGGIPCCAYILLLRYHREPIHPVVK